MFAARNAGARSESTRDSAALMLVRRRTMRRESGEHQQVAHNLCGAIGLAINPLHVAPKRLRKGAGRAQQLEMAEHALQRVVQLVRDARDELPERSQFFRLHEPVAQLGAFGLELGLRRHVARNEHDADRLPFFSDERRQRHEERASQLFVLDFCRDDLRGLTPVLTEWVRPQDAITSAAIRRSAPSTR